MGAEKTIVDVNKGQDAYSVIGNYILNHITAIEDMIAVIQINEVIMNELYMVDMDADGYFYWNSDWWEGEENVALLDYFPVSEAERKDWIPCSERLPEEEQTVLVTCSDGQVYIYDRLKASDYEYDDMRFWEDNIGCYQPREDVVAWMPLPESYRAERRIDVKADKGTSR